MLENTAAAASTVGLRRERFRQRRIAVGGSLVDQQEIDRDHLRLQPRDRLDDPGDLRARQRIGAAELDDGVVDRDDRDEIRRRLDAARQRSRVRSMPNSSRSRNRKWPLLWPSQIAPAHNPVQSNATRI